MRTNSKEVKEQIKQHIVDCVYDYEENNFPTFDGAKKHLLSEFDRVANHKYNLQRFPNNQERFSDYLNGLPFHFEYEQEGIKDYLNDLGINPEGKEFENAKSLRLYHYLIFRAIN